MNRQPGKPWLRIRKDCVSREVWNFTVQEIISGSPGRPATVAIAWGGATVYENALAAGQSALRRELAWRAQAAKEEPVVETKTDQRPVLTAASHLASSERRWSFGFSAGHEVWT